MWKFLPFKKSYNVNCPDGSTKTVYKDVNDAFALWIDKWIGNIAAEVVETIGGEIKSEYASKIEGLLDALDELNQGLMMTFRAVYISYADDPCGTTQFFQREISRIYDERRKLKALNLQIDGLITMVKTQPNNPDKFTELFAEIVHGIGIYPSHEVVIAEMQRAQKDAKALSGGAK